MQTRVLLRRSIALLASCVVVAAATGAAGSARAAVTDQEAGLVFRGFINNSALTAPDGTHPLKGGLLMVGADDGLHAVVLHDRFNKVFYELDLDGDFAQVASIDSQAPQNSAVTAVDPSLHRAYVGTQVSSDVCGTVVLACTKGPVAVSPKVEVVDLVKRQSVALVSLPAWAAGRDVVALAPTATSAGRHLLLAMLYQNASGPAEVGLVHALTLVALDADQLTNPAVDPVVWHHDISSCASLLSWNTNNTGMAREYLGVDPAGRFVYFGCRGFVEGASSGHFAPAGAIVVDLNAAEGQEADLPASARTFTENYFPYGANGKFASSGGDPAHNILEFATIGSGAYNKLYVFDAEHRAWTGSIPFVVVGTGSSSANKNLYGVANDPSTGRAYVYYPTTSMVSSELTQVPVPQGVSLSLGDFQTRNGGAFPIVDPARHLIFLPQQGGFSHADGSAYAADAGIAVFQDTRPEPAPAVVDDPDAFTHDIEVSAATPVNYAALASAYGMKATLVGGAHSLPGVGDAYDRAAPATAEDNACNNANLFGGLASADHVRCDALIPSISDGDRSFTFGQVTRTELSNSAASGDASTLTVDDSTTADRKAMSSYNPAVDVWNRFIQPPTNEDPPSPDTSGLPTAPDPSQELAPATCKDFGGKPSSATGQASTVSCSHDGQQTSGAAASGALAPDSASSGPTTTDPGGQTTPVQVAYAGSATSVWHDADNNAVAQAIAVTRGIRLAIPGGPTVTIGEVRAWSTSSAAGVKGSAASTFGRALSNVVVRAPGRGVVFSCGFAPGEDTEMSSATCDPRALTDAVSAQSPSPVIFVTPVPDPTLRKSPGGAQAVVIKSLYQYWNDYITNADPSLEVPALQVVLVGDQNEPSRLVLNLAAVHVESHDVIGLPPPQPPPLSAPSLQLTLVDGSTPPAPLSGGAFSLQGPDGTPAKSCTTAADGVGTCTFAELVPGSYTLHEATAPPGYAASPDYQVSLEAGKAYRITFVNLPAIGSVQVTLSAPDTDRTPLAGGSFAMFTGTDVLATPVATCTTDDAGTCGFDNVPLGDYTMQQTSAPEGYLVSDSVPFALTEPGQSVQLDFVDGTPDIPPVPPTVIPGTPAVPPKVIPGKPAVPPKVIPGKPAIPPHTEVVPVTDLPPLQQAGYSMTAPPPVVATAPLNLDQGSGPLLLGGVPSAVGRVPGQLARLAFHTPRQALLLLFMWLVLGLPAYLWVRRRQFILATEGV